MTEAQLHAIRNEPSLKLLEQLTVNEFLGLLIKVAKEVHEKANTSKLII